MAAIDDAIASLLTRMVAQYLTNGGYVTLFPQDMASVALIAQYAAQQASAAGSSATLAAGSLAAAQAITGALAKRRTDDTIHRLPPHRGKLAIALEDLSGREAFVLDVSRGGISLKRRTY